MADSPSTTTRIALPYLSLVKKNDPTFFKDRVKQPEYEFRGRTFTANPAQRGAYTTIAGPDNIYKEATPDIGVLGDMFNE